MMQNNFNGSCILHSALHWSKVPHIEEFYVQPAIKSLFSWTVTMEKKKTVVGYDP